MQNNTESTREKKTILVIGATGHQGGQVARSILQSATTCEKWTVRAFTRNPQSATSKQLEKMGAVVVKGDLDDEDSIRAAMQGAHAVYSVQVSDGKGGTVAEERQGKLVADLCKELGVEHLIYSSVEGAERNSGIQEYLSKWNIEEHIRRLQVPHTILRPTCFMTLFTDADMARTFLTIMRTFMKNDRKLQVVAPKDIGITARIALENREQYLGKVIRLATEELTRIEIQQILKEENYACPTPLIVPKFVFRLLVPDTAKMMEWFQSPGFEANIEEFRNINPTAISFRQHIRELKEDDK